MIRLLHDPGLVAALYDDPARALAGVDVNAIEVAWLTAQPRVAWCTDPARPARVLAALAAEFPATCALAAERAAEFFASFAFHAAVQTRGSLALAFGDHLAASDDRRVRTLAVLERAIAVVRRAPRAHETIALGALRLSARACVVRVATGGLALLAAVRTGEEPETLAAGDEAVLAFARTVDDEVTLEPLEPALAAVLERAQGPTPEPELRAEARRHGAEAGEDAEVLASLVADGLLVRGTGTSTARGAGT